MKFHDFLEKAQIEKPVPNGVEFEVKPLWSRYAMPALLLADSQSLYHCYFLEVDPELIGEEVPSTYCDDRYFVFVHVECDGKIRERIHPEWLELVFVFPSGTKLQFDVDFVTNVMWYDHRVI